MNNLMKQMINEKIQWLREHNVLCYVGNLDSATPEEIDKLCEAIENMTALVVEAEGESKPWEADDEDEKCGCGCCSDCDRNDADIRYLELVESLQKDMYKKIKKCLIQMMEITDGFPLLEWADVTDRYMEIAEKVLTDIVEEYEG